MQHMFIEGNSQLRRGIAFAEVLCKALVILSLHRAFVQIQVVMEIGVLYSKCYCKCEVIVKYSTENISFTASSVCSYWMREEAALLRRDADGICDICHAKLKQILVRLVRSTIAPSFLLRNFPQCRCWNRGQQRQTKCVVHLRSLTHCFCVVSSEIQQQWAHRWFCIGKTHIALLPHFFKILYLSWERPFINILLIFACTAPSCLISYQTLLLMGYHNTQEVCCLPGLLMTGQLLWSNPGNILNQSGCRSVRWHTLFSFFLMPNLYTSCKVKGSVIYSQINTVNAPSVPQ